MWPAADRLPVAPSGRVRDGGRPVRRTFRSAHELRALAAVARGEQPADLVLAGASVLNVYSGEVARADVAVLGERIALVGDCSRAVGPGTHVADVAGRVVAPGYIDPHAHPQALTNPVEFARAALARGATTVVADTMFLLTLPGDAPARVLRALSGLPLQYLWFLRAHSQTHDPDEDATFAAERLAPFLEIDEVRTLGEMTRWRDVYSGDEDTLGKIAMALAGGRRVEGHSPGASAPRLQALAAAGVSSDHEAITAPEALDRLRAGLYVMLRHSSLREDLPALAAVASRERAFSGRIMLTADGPTPSYVLRHGYLDHVIRVAIEAGIPPVAAYQMATLNPATYYGLDEELGGIAPGRRADLVVLERLENPTPVAVYSRGRLAAEDGRVVIPFPAVPWDDLIPRRFAPTWDPAPHLFEWRADGDTVTLPVMVFENAVITRRRDRAFDVRGGRVALPEETLYMTVLDHRGRWMARTLVEGLLAAVEGFAATYSIGGGVLVLGRDPVAMAAAARRALELGGGLVLVEGGAVIFELPLEIGGLMSRAPFEEVAAAVERLSSLARERGYRHGDLPYTLLFVGFDSLPDLRLTYRGLWDVKAQAAVLPRIDLR